MATNKTNKTNNCLSEESFSLIHEESRENSFSFTSREMKRSFQRTDDKMSNCEVSFYSLLRSNLTSYHLRNLKEKKEMIATSLRSSQ